MPDVLKPTSLLSGIYQELIDVLPTNKYEIKILGLWVKIGKSTSTSKIDYILCTISINSQLVYRFIFTKCINFAQK